MAHAAIINYAEQCLVVGKDNPCKIPLGTSGSVCPIAQENVIVPQNTTIAPRTAQILTVQLDHAFPNKQTGLVEPINTKVKHLMLKYVHVELVFFFVTNPNKIDRLTYHSIAKVVPVLSAVRPGSSSSEIYRLCIFPYLLMAYFRPRGISHPLYSNKFLKNFTGHVFLRVHDRIPPRNN